MNENKNSNTKRFLTWTSFIIIIGLIVWGLIVAENKSNKENSSILLPEQVVDTDHIRGDKTAPVTLVEYSDFQCPACKSFYPFVERLLSEEASSTLRFVYRHFPLTQHKNAIPASKASESAHIQGKFWEMYNILFDKQQDWESSSDAKTIFIGYAKDLGLDTEKFSEDMESKEVKNIVNNDYRSGVKAKLKGTPSFFLNGRYIDNPQSYDSFKKIIDDEYTKIAS